MIYAGGRDVLAFGEGGPPRWGAADSVLRPSLHASLAGAVAGTGRSSTACAAKLIRPAIAARPVDHTLGAEV